MTPSHSTSLRRRSARSSSVLRSTLLPALWLGALAPGLVAQSAPPELAAGAAPAPSLPPAVERRLLGAELDEPRFAVDAEGDLWVRGRTYKASFGAHGARYLPFLGSQAPRNFPVGFRVAEARLGSTRLELEAPVARREGDRICIDRGALRAEYVPGLEGLEQLFVLDAPAAGAGDLVVHLAVETELELKAAEAGLLFEGPHGGVSYGEAFVLDAAGRRLATPAALEAGALRIRVPRDFLEQASFPVAIDPLIATQRLDDSGPEQRHPDITFDPVEGTFIVAFHELFSADDFDVKLVRTDGAGNVLGWPFYADFTSVNARHPRVAVNQFDRRGLVVYTTGGDGARKIEGNLLDLTAQADVLPRLTISDNPEGLDLARPDVAGDAFDGPDAWFTVVWERIWNPNDADIVLRQVTPAGILLPEQLVTNFGGIRDEAPSISTAPPVLGIHNVVWRRNGNEVVGAQYDFGGLVATPPFSMFTYDPSFGLSVPSVSAVGPFVPGESERAYAVAASLHFPGSNQSDALIFTFAGDQFIDSASDPYLEHTNPVDDALRPTVAAAAEGFALAYEGAPSVGAPHRTYITGFNLANRSLAVSERRVLGDLGTGDHYDPRIVSTWESGQEGASFAYGPFAVVSQDSGDIEFGLYQGFQVSGAQHEFCHGFENSTGERAFLTITGDADDTSGTHTLTVRNLPPNKVGIFVASLNPAAPGIVPPGSSGRLCVAGPLARFPTLVNSGPGGALAMNLDPTAIPAPGGPVAAAPGQTWYFQLWHRDVGVGGSTSNFSNAAAIPFH